MIVIKSQDGGLFECNSVRQDCKLKAFILGGTTGEQEYLLGKYTGEKEAKFVMDKITEHLQTCGSVYSVSYTRHDGQSEKRTYPLIFEMPQEICWVEESEVV